MLLSVIIFRIALVALIATIAVVFLLQFRSRDRLEAFRVVDAGIYGIVSIMVLMGASFVLNFMGL